MEIRQFDLPGLGHLSALLVDESSGQAAVIDPRRDVDIYLDEVARRGLHLGHVLETHVHNDYVSGARELAAVTGATHVIGAAAGLGTAFQPVRAGQAIDVGRLRLTVLETPGHTPEHVSYAVRDAGPSAGDDPVAIFTGGSMLVGSVGRTDLLGPEHARPYALDMHRSLHETLLRQPDEADILPTHGAGSLCSRGIGEAWSSTVGIERTTDPLLAIEDPEAFADALLAGQPAVPRYFSRMRGINRAGPRMLGKIPAPQPLDPPVVRGRVAAGAQLIDLRPAAAFAAAYVPGSISLPADASFGTWLGWIVEPDRPLILLLPERASWDDAVRQALRVGYDTIVGYLDGGLEAWRAAGGEVAAGLAQTVLELATSIRSAEPPLVLDVRQADEYAAGHVAACGRRPG